jgi:hypothetical protein
MDRKFFFGVPGIAGKAYRADDGAIVKNGKNTFAFFLDS